MVVLILKLIKTAHRAASNSYCCFLSRSKEVEITFPIYEEDKDHVYHTIDGLSFLTDDIVGKWRCFRLLQSS